MTTSRVVVVVVVVVVASLSPFLWPTVERCQIRIILAVVIASGARP
jgi:hypothetical protein